MKKDLVQLAIIGLVAGACMAGCTCSKNPEQKQMQQDQSSCGGCKKGCDSNGKKGKDSSCGGSGDSSTNETDQKNLDAQKLKRKSVVEKISQNEAE